MARDLYLSQPTDANMVIENVFTITITDSLHFCESSISEGN